MLVNVTHDSCPEEYSEPYQTSKMECFVETVNGENLPTIFAKHSILDFRQGSECVSVIYDKIRKKNMTVIKYLCRNFHVAKGLRQRLW